jgi:hypothetical protein
VYVSIVENKIQWRGKRKKIDLPVQKNGYVTGEWVAREATGRFFGDDQNKSKYYIKNVAKHTRV